MKSNIAVVAISLFYFIGCPACVFAGEQGHDHAWQEENGHHEDSGHEEHAEKVHLKKESQRMIGLELAEVKQAPLLSSVEVIGEIAQDSENTIHVTSKTSGVLEKMNVGLGDVVEKGTLVCSVKDKGTALHEIVSPFHGIVMAIYLKENDRVDELNTIMTIVDPDVMKASFNLYEKDLAGVRLGQKVIAKTVAYPQEEFRGEIVYISPQIDIKTRTVKIRVNIKNEEHLLKFGMYLTGKILVPLAEQAMVVPEEAVQQVEGKTVVFVPQGNEGEEFLAREVRLGRRAEGFVEILEGVKEGDIIAGKGSFYLKAELQKGELEQGHAH